MTEPTTAAGREREECGECFRTEGEGHAPHCSGRAEVRQQDGSALRKVLEAEQRQLIEALDLYAMLLIVRDFPRAEASA